MTNVGFASSLALIACPKPKSLKASGIKICPIASFNLVHSCSKFVRLKLTEGRGNYIHTFKSSCLGQAPMPLNGVDEIKVCTRKLNITHLLIFLHEGGGLTEAASLTATNSFQFSGGKKVQLTSGLRLNSLTIFKKLTSRWKLDSRRLQGSFGGRTFSRIRDLQRNEALTFCSRRNRF